MKFVRVGVLLLFILIVFVDAVTGAYKPLLMAEFILMGDAKGVEFDALIVTV